MPPIAIEDFQIGRVVNRTFGIFGRNFVIFLTTAVLFMLPALAADLYVGTPNYLLAGATKGWTFGVLAGVPQFVCPYLLAAALVKAAIADLNGDRPSLGDVVSTGFALFLPVLLLTIMSLFGVMLGIMLLLVPGIILMTGWAVVIPVRAAEHTGIVQSFGRSWDLTRDYRWKIFGLLMLYVIVASLLNFVVQLIFGVSFAQTEIAGSSTPYISLMWLNSVILGLFYAVGVAALYYELRTVKEGVGPQQLAAAFD
jgi:hypothetical protein